MSEGGKTSMLVLPTREAVEKAVHRVFKRHMAIRKRTYNRAPNAWFKPPEGVAA